MWVMLGFDRIISGLRYSLGTAPPATVDIRGPIKSYI